MRRPSLWRIVLAILAVILIGGAVSIALLLREGVIKRRVVSALSNHLNSDVTLGPMSMTLYPSVRIVAEGLTVRRRVDPPEQAPLIQASRFTAELGLWQALNGRARYVEVEGLRVSIPRRPATRPTLIESAGETPIAAPAGIESSAQRKLRGTLERVVARNAELVYASRKPGRPPRVIRVHEIELSGVSFDQPMGFRTTLTNPVPEGHLETSGTFGPLDAEDPGRSAIEGSYVLTGADFNTIKGLAGSVDSRGLFYGQLDQMQVAGTTETSNFQLDVGNHPLPLHTEFRAMVDGTDGDVHLDHVQAKLNESPFTATGTITGLPGVRGRRVALDVKVAAGRVEDFLTLVLPATRPVMVGDVALAMSFLLPLGDGRAIDRLELNGTIGITEANFSDRATQARVRELSRRAQGKKKDAPFANALMGLSSRFAFKSGTARFTSLRFSTPGAVVSVAGTYTLKSGAMNLRGTARLQTSLSKAVGGIKGFFLKLADPLFRKDGAGAVIPISITGPHDAPKVSLDKGRLFGR